MPCRLIINADDFGLTQGINRAISDLHLAGAVTSTTLMANGPAFEHAVRLIQDLPSLGVGCHVVLVDGTPVSPPHQVPSLLGPDGRTFRPSLPGFLRDLLLGRIRPGEIQIEAEAQIRKLQGFGITVTHLDTHKHTHVFPGIARSVLLAAQRCGICAVRNPFEPRWSMAATLNRPSKIRLAELSLLAALKPSVSRLLSSDPAILTTNGTLGIAATGCLDTPVLHSILHAAYTHAKDNQVYELVCHPGHNDDDLARISTRLRAHREVEQKALLQMLEAPKPLALIHYGDLVP